MFPATWLHLSGKEAPSPARAVTELLPDRRSDRDPRGSETRSKKVGGEEGEWRGFIKRRGVGGRPERYDGRLGAENTKKELWF